jgi:hypothetical protein
VPDDSGAVVLPEGFGASTDEDVLPAVVLPDDWVVADAPEKQTVDKLVDPTSVEDWYGTRVERYARRPDQPAKVEPTPVVAAAVDDVVSRGDAKALFDPTKGFGAPVFDLPEEGESSAFKDDPPAGYLYKTDPETDEMALGTELEAVPEDYVSPWASGPPKKKEELPEETQEKFAEGGVAGKGGEEEIIVGEEGPELVLPAALTRKIMALAESRKGKKPAPEADAATESDEDAELALLQDGVAQRAEGVYKLGKAMYEATDEKPPPTVATVMQIMRLTKTLTLNVSYMEEMLDRAEDEEKMSPSWYKHMNDLQFYSERVDKLNAAIDKLKEGVDMAKLQQQVQAEQPQGGSRGR